MGDAYWQFTIFLIGMIIAISILVAGRNIEQAIKTRVTVEVACPPGYHSVQTAPNRIYCDLAEESKHD